MKTKLLLTFFFLVFISFSTRAQEPTDTTVIILRELNPGPPPHSGSANPYSDIEMNSIEIFYTEHHLLIYPNDFISQIINVTIKDFYTDYIYYVDDILSNFNNDIDISSLPIGVYTISIIDEDDEYIGEFEVF